MNFDIQPIPQDPPKGCDTFRVRADLPTEQLLEWLFRGDLPEEMAIRFASNEEGFHFRTKNERYWFARGLWSTLPYGRREQARKVDPATWSRAEGKEGVLTP